MNGRASTPIKAVNSSSTAVSLCLKYCSTRYLSKCVEIAHSTGPENAKTSQDIGLAALGGGPVRAVGTLYRRALVWSTAPAAPLQARRIRHCAWEGAAGNWPPGTGGCRGLAQFGLSF